MITSTSSSQVKHVVQLQKKARTRKEFKEFVVEGLRIVSEVPQDRLVKVYASETFAATNEQFLSKYNDKLEITSDNVFMQMSDTKTPQGVLAVVNIKEAAVNDMLNNNPLLIIVENLQDPGNLGTIIRMGEGAGISGIIMNRNTVDIYNPKTIRSTMGSIFRVPFVYADDFEQVLCQCKEAGVTLYAAHLDGKDMYDCDYSRPTAFLIGNEGNGLTDGTTVFADEKVRIPMQGTVESLNAAMACTILSYEAVRQRR